MIGVACSLHQSAPAVTEWKTLYAKIIPLTEDGRREILSVVE